MNFRLAQPALLVDLNRVEGLDGWSAGEGGAVRIGGLTRLSALERRPDLASASPLLAEALPWVAHPQIRNRSTIGGTLAHADPAAEVPAVCLTEGARFRLARRGGERWVEATDFFRGLFETALEPEEALVEVELPAPHAGSWELLPGDRPPSWGLCPRRGSRHGSRWPTTARSDGPVSST